MNGKDQFWVLMYLGEAYDVINLYIIWQILRMERVAGELLNAVQSLYVDVCRVIGWE